MGMPANANAIKRMDCTWKNVTSCLIFKPVNPFQIAKTMGKVTL